MPWSCRPSGGRFMAIGWFGGGDPGRGLRAPRHRRPLGRLDAARQPQGKGAAVTTPPQTRPPDLRRGGGPHPGQDRGRPRCARSDRRAACPGPALRGGVPPSWPRPCAGARAAGPARPTPRCPSRSASTARWSISSAPPGRAGSPASTRRCGTRSPEGFGGGRSRRPGIGCTPETRVEGSVEGRCRLEPGGGVLGSPKGSHGAALRL